jgi:hypothetical protein
LVLIQLSSATASGMAPMSAAFVEQERCHRPVLLVVRSDTLVAIEPDARPS